MKPEVTWLLCTNRNDSLLHHAIASCLAQTFEDFELIVVTNGIEAEVIAESLRRSYPQPNIHVLSTATRQLNFSLALGTHVARGVFIARMDADDESLPDRLARQAAFMREHPDVAVLCSGYDVIDMTGERVASIAPPADHSEICRRLRYSNPICHPTVMVRANAVREVGGYLGGLHAEDYDLWCRVMVTGTWRFASIEERLLRYRFNPGGAARRSRAAYASMATAQLRSFFESSDLRWMAGAAMSTTKHWFRGR